MLSNVSLSSTSTSWTRRWETMPPRQHRQRLIRTPSQPKPWRETSKWCRCSCNARTKSWQRCRRSLSGWNRNRRSAGSWVKMHMHMIMTMMMMTTMTMDVMVHRKPSSKRCAVVPATSQWQPDCTRGGTSGLEKPGAIKGQLDQALPEERLPEGPHVIWFIYFIKICRGHVYACIYIYTHIYVYMYICLEWKDNFIREFNTLLEKAKSLELEISGDFHDEDEMKDELKLPECL